MSGCCEPDDTEVELESRRGMTKVELALEAVPEDAVNEDEDDDIM